jgi:class 3 adenylate cyclase
MVLAAHGVVDVCPACGFDNARDEFAGVTVLFADVEGSMNLAEQVDPEATKLWRLPLARAGGRGSSGRR